MASYSEQIRKGSQESIRDTVNNSMGSRDLDAAKDAYTLNKGLAKQNQVYETKLREAQAMLNGNGLQKKVLGDYSTQLLAQSKVTNNAMEAYFLKMGSSAAGGLNAASAVTLEATKLWQSTFSGGIWGMSRFVAGEISSAIGSIHPALKTFGAALGGAAEVFISSAQALFDWQIQQNQQLIKAKAVTGKEGAVKFGDIPGMGLADIAKWDAAALAGGVSGAEKTNEGYEYSYTQFNQSKLREASKKLGRTIEEEGTAAVKNALSSGEIDTAKLKSTGMSAGKEFVGGLETETKRGYHQVTVAEKLFQLGTSMGLSDVATGQMFAQMKSATGDTQSALDAMSRSFEVAQDAARRTGVSANVFMTAIMGSTAQARMLNVDMKSVQNTVTMLSKSQKEMGAFGIDSQAQDAEITKDLVDRTKMSAAQHTNLGMEIAGQLGIQPKDTMEAWALSRYGSKMANNIQFSGDNYSVAGDGPGTFGSLTGDTHAEAIKAMRASLYKETQHLQGAARMYAMQQLAKTKYGLGEASATALIVTKSDEDVDDLAENKEFQNTMKPTQELAAQTLTSQQRMEMIQRSLVVIVTNITAVAAAGFTQLVRIGLTSIAALDDSSISRLSKLFGGAGLAPTGVREALTSILNNENLKGMDFGATTAGAIQTITNETRTLKSEVEHRGGGIFKEIRQATKFSTNDYIGDSRLTNGGDAPDDKDVEQFIRKHKSDGNLVEGGQVVKHDGGTFSGAAKVLTNEFFTPAYHSGGVYPGSSGKTFTFDTSTLNSNEAFMVANKPMNVQTPSQFSKSNGSNGPIYNMSFTITGVASKSDIVQTFTKAINEAIG